MNNTTTMNKERLVEIKFNKKVWNKTITNIIKSVMLAITIFAFIFLMESFVAMVEQWSISGSPLIINMMCWTWFIIFGLYIHFINK